MMYKRICALHVKIRWLIFIRNEVYKSRNYSPNSERALAVVA